MNQRGTNLKYKKGRNKPSPTLNSGETVELSVSSEMLRNDSQKDSVGGTRE